MLLLCSGSGLHSKTSSSATRVPTSFLMALWTSAYGSSCPNPHLCVICTRSTPLRRENWSALFCPPSKSLNSPGCGIFFKLPRLCGAEPVRISASSDAYPLSLKRQMLESEVCLAPHDAVLLLVHRFQVAVYDFFCICFVHVKYFCAAHVKRERHIL